MYEPGERAGIFGVYLLGPLLGPTIGPLLGSIILYDNLLFHHSLFSHSSFIEGDTNNCMLDPILNGLGSSGS